METSLAIALQSLVRGYLYRRALRAEMRALLLAEGLEHLLEPEDEDGDELDARDGSASDAPVSGGEEHRADSAANDPVGSAEGVESRTAKEDESMGWAQRVLEEIEKARLEREKTPELTEEERRRFDHLSTITDVYLGSLRDSSLLNDERPSPRASLPSWGISFMDDDMDDNNYHPARVGSPHFETTSERTMIRIEKPTELPELVVVRDSREPPGLGDNRSCAIRALSPNRSSRTRRKGGWRDALAEQRRAELARFREQTAALRTENMSQRLDDETSRRERAAAVSEGRLEARSALQRTARHRHEDAMDVKCQLAALKESTVREVIRASDKEERRRASLSSKLAKRVEKQAASLLSATARQADIAMLRSLKLNQMESPGHRTQFALSNLSDSSDMIDDMRLDPIDINAYNASREAIEEVEAALRSMNSDASTVIGIRSPVMMPIPPPLSPARGHRLQSPTASRRMRTARMHSHVPLSDADLDGGFLYTRPLTSSKGKDKMNDE